MTVQRREEARPGRVDLHKIVLLEIQLRTDNWHSILQEKVCQLSVCANYPYYSIWRAIGTGLRKVCQLSVCANYPCANYPFSTVGALLGVRRAADGLDSLLVALHRR